MGYPIFPINWADPTVALLVEDYEEVDLQVIGTPGAGYTPQRSLDGTNFVACNAYDKDLNIVTSITAAGIYTVEGGGWIKLTGGSGSTVIARADA